MGEYVTRGSLSETVGDLDRKSTRLNSSHGYISYAVFCLKKKIIDAGFENQKELTKMQLQNQKENAEMQTESQQEMDDIQSPTSLQNTKDKVYAKNAMVE